MQILIAPDKFKGSLTASAFCQAAAQGAKEALPGARVIEMPLSDGGDGFSEVMHQYGGFHWVDCIASDPLGRAISVSYLLSEDRQTACIELARVSGLSLLLPKEQNCFHTSSFGLGEVILNALSRGVDKVIIGLGGSATNDGGMGMAMALGYKFLDARDQVLKPAGNQLQKIQSIAFPAALDFLRRVEFIAVTDVENELLGEAGATMTYGIQKGATTDELIQLEEGLKNMAARISRYFGLSVADLPASGAAGGLGAGCYAFLNARLEPGADFVMEVARFDDNIKHTSLVITGEGRLDSQSIQGKLPVTVARRARTFGVPVAVIAGQVAPDFTGHGFFDFVRSIAEMTSSINEAKNEAFTYIKKISFDLICQFKNAHNG